MALDPESQRLLDLMAAANRPAWITLTPNEAREQYLSTRAGAQGPRPEGVNVTDRTIPGPGGPIPVRIYRPDSAASEARLPALVFAHGGGWVFGNLDSHDVLCAQLALEAGIAVFADRLSPRAGGALPRRLRRRGRRPQMGRRPTALGRHRLPARLAIGGDSAGGNLAAAVAIWARDNGGPEAEAAAARLSRHRCRGTHQVLSPVLRRLRPECADHGVVLRPLHAGQGRARRLARLAAARQFAGRPAAGAGVTAGYDALRDEGRAYAWRLQKEGTVTDLVEFGGMLHGFLSSPMLLHGARRGAALCAAALREALVLRAQ